MNWLNDKQKETIASLIAEGVHVGLCKGCDSRQSSVAWNAINGLPDGEWGQAVKWAADEVVHYIESREDADA